MGKAPAGADAIMSVPEMKQVLAKAKRGDPVGCAFGLGKDKDAVLLLDGKKKPRKLMSELKKKAAAAGLEVASSMIRFGRAEIDGADDARTVIFVVNKEAPGMVRAALTRLLRPAGFGHVEIMVDEALETETEDDMPADPAAPPMLGSPPSPEVLPTAAPTPAPAFTPGASATSAALAADAALATIGKSSLVWDATRRQIEKQLNDLHKAMTEAYKDHGFGAELDRVFHATVQPMIESFDDTLSHKLADVQRATDAAARAPLLDEARQIIANYERYLASEPLMEKLDRNPFTPMTLAKTLTASLEVLNKSLASAAARMGH